MLQPLAAVKAVIVLTSALCALAQPASWLHGWDTASDMLWVDFAGANYRYALTPAQLAFVAATYKIVSLEKCFEMSVFPYNEDSVPNVTRTLKALNPSLKVLYYFHSIQNYAPCSRAGNTFKKQPSWALLNDTGAPVLSGTDVYFDLNQSVVRQFVAAASVNVTGDARIFDGVFADGSIDTKFAGVSSGRFAELVAGHHISLALTRAAVAAAMAPDALFFGNGLAQYSNNPPDHGMAAAPFLDGLCYEHFMGFEMLKSGTGALATGAFALAVALIRNSTNMGKVVLVKAWPGPVASPILATGPSWYGPVPAPTDYAGRAAAAAAWLTPALAAYLIIATNATYFSYTTWYTAPDGAYPCPLGTCSAPSGWYPELSLPLGPPLGDYTVGGRIWTRNYTYATVVFNEGNVSLSTITWRQPSPSPSPSPSVTATPPATFSSSSSPSNTATPSQSPSPSTFSTVSSTSSPSNTAALSQSPSPSTFCTVSSTSSTSNTATLSHSTAVSSAPTSSQAAALTVTPGVLSAVNASGSSIAGVGAAVATGDGPVPALSAAGAAGISILLVVGVAAAGVAVMLYRRRRASAFPLMFATDSSPLSRHTPNFINVASENPMQVALEPLEQPRGHGTFRMMAAPTPVVTQWQPRRR